MQEYQQRVVDEQAELSTKLTKLSNYMQSKLLNEQCSKAEVDRLEQQSTFMRGYNNMLLARIAAFPK